MVKQRKAIESLYEGVCTITGSQEVIVEDGTTEFEEVVICEGQPCRLSFGSSKTQTGEAATETTQEAKLFLAPEIVVPAGSHVVVTQHERMWEYKLSSTPAVYSSHQEISFSLKDRWT
jgi:hypothetical protein